MYHPRCRGGLLQEAALRGHVARQEGVAEAMKSLRAAERAAARREKHADGELESARHLLAGARVELKRARVRVEELEAADTSGASGQIKARMEALRREVRRGHGAHRGLA